MITCTFENGRKTALRHVVVHAIVEKNGKLLLVKRAPELSEGGKWSLPSGFLDRDETVSEAVLRELREETGLEGAVASLFIIKSDPKRPHEDRQNVSFHFLVTPLSETGVHDSESTAVAWVDISVLPPLSGLAFDHGEAVALYLTHRGSPIPLPIML